MGKILLQNFIKLMVAVLATAIFSMGVLSFFAMDHGMKKGESCALAAQVGNNSANPMGLPACFEYQVGVLNELATSIPLINQVLLLIIALTLVSIFIFLPDEHLARNFLILRLLFRRLYENFVARFFKQLGDWLSFFEKADPSLRYLYARQV